MAGLYFKELLKKRLRPGILIGPAQGSLHATVDAKSRNALDPEAEKDLQLLKHLVILGWLPG
jgi:hypothetical protein